MPRIESLEVSLQERIDEHLGLAREVYLMRDTFVSSSDFLEKIKDLETRLSSLVTYENFNTKMNTVSEDIK
jgi:hypothetical protein